MATNILSAVPIYGVSINSGAFEREAVPPMPAGGFLAGAALASSVTHHLPLATVRHTFANSTLAHSFGLTDWYFRIHIIPSALNLGNVVSDEIFTIGVWNAWLYNDQILNSITEFGFDGLLLSGQPAPPLTFKPNQQRNYSLEISAQGPPTIDAEVDFTFADAEVRVLLITGNRITAWALTPDWADGVSEKLGWKTDVLTAWTGDEQRRALRLSPRRVFRFNTWAQGAEKQFLENALFAWSAMVWALPVWYDGQRLGAHLVPGAVAVTCDTDLRDFKSGGLAMLLVDARTFEVLQIDTVSSGSFTLVHPTALDWPAGSKLYPVRACRMLTKPRLARETGQIASIQPEFTTVEPCDWPAATGLPTYRGVAVLENSPDETNPTDTGFERQAFIIDNDTGSIDVIDTAGVGFSSRVHAWFMKGKADRGALRSLLYLLKGRQGEIWVPTYEMDLTLLQDIGGGQTNLHCANSGYVLYGNTLNRRDVRIELLNGTVYYRRVTGATVESSASELLNIDSALSGSIIVKTAVRRISFMPLCRLDADEIEIMHLTGIQGVATAATPFRAVKHDI